ncbi:MAG: ABC transporter ATP-binding protein [Malacoplasma sp.]|nr:ABC transporter ATP-binding protein [Malacoplasma sp.]MDE5953053.1 ABC transporter ATP-binding protein [Malacoplasma sp.]MDE7075027.1 ABC transporter ATP-binding protein [Malacoplasma sp.]
MSLRFKHFIHDEDKKLAKDQIIKIKDLKVNFKVKDGLLQAVRGVDISVYKGQIIGIVGESGSGKSVCVKSLIGFNDGASTEAENLNLAGIDILKVKRKTWPSIRGTYVAYIPQDPLMSLNPTKTIGKQVLEAIYVSEKSRYNQIKNNKRNEIDQEKWLFENFKNNLKKDLESSKITQEKHDELLLNAETKHLETINNLTKKHDELIAKAKEEYKNNTKKVNAKNKVVEILKFIGIENVESRLKSYPHEFSGGMRQRIVIAIAVATKPDIIIADEPTTALDVTVQAKVLSLIKQLREVYGITVIFISHNIALVANFCDYIYVMYAGKIVEQGLTEEIFINPLHPYTWALLASIPDSNVDNQKLEPIAGTPPNLITPPKGDAFAPRNKYAIALDFEKQPPLFEVSDTHKAATWLLHPKAPKIELPDEVKEKISKSKKSFEIYVKQKKNKKELEK